MGVNLTSGAISKILTGKCTWKDLKPVLQVIFIASKTHTIDNKPWYGVMLSDGSSSQVGIIAEEIFISNKLQNGSIVQLTMFRLIDPHRYILVCDLTLLRTTCNTIGDPKPLPDNVEETPTSKQKQGNVDSHLTSGAISKLMTGKCTENDLKPVLQVIDIYGPFSIDDEEWYGVVLSDGSNVEYVFIASEIVISNKLQQGSIIQLTEYDILKDSGIVQCIVLIWDCNLLSSKCDIIGYPLNETPLVEGSTPTIPDEDHVDSHLNENIDDSRHVEEPPTSKQKQDHVNLTLGGLTKIMPDICTSNDLKLVLQLMHISENSFLMHSTNAKQMCGVLLSDGSSSRVGFIADETIRSKQLQDGSVVQLTKFQLVKGCNNMGEMTRYVVQKGFGGN